MLCDCTRFDAVLCVFMWIMICSRSTALSVARHDQSESEEAEKMRNDINYVNLMLLGGPCEIIDN